VGELRLSRLPRRGGGQGGDPSALFLYSFFFYSPSKENLTLRRSDTDHLPVPPRRLPAPKKAVASPLSQWEEI